MNAKFAHQHVVRRIAKDAQSEPTDPALVGQGMMKLYSFYAPSLVGGDYWIDSFQSISVTTDILKPPQTKTVYNYTSLPNPPLDPTTAVRQVQQFEVVAPQFSIPLDDITTHYPPDGHQDEGRVLPHIVFNDPHLPWERYPGISAPFTGPEVTSDKQYRESVPWLAVVVFDPEELLLTADEITALKIPPAPVVSLNNSPVSPTNVPPNGAYPMSVQQYLNIDRFSRIEYNVDPLYPEYVDSQESTKVIFPSKDLFEQLFGTRDLLEQNKSLAHVRNINTTGMPDAGVEETGLFSIIISRRSGPANLTAPKTQMAHLISIENFDSTIDRVQPPGQPTTSRMGLVSLFSWTYTALPPNPVNFIDSMIAIGGTTQFIKPDQKILDGLTKSPSNPKSAQKLAKRLENGYIFSRWRIQTGEETVSFNRGPLVPIPVNSPEKTSKWPGTSNFGTDYQILDTEIGMMDVSYSSAWQLGKSLAIGDRVFCGALMRLRALVYTNAASDTRIQVGTMNPSSDLFKSISAQLDKIVDLSKSSSVTPVRWSAPRSQTLAAGLNDPTVQPTFQEYLLSETRKQTMSLDVTQPGGIGSAPYNGFNKPVNNDWAVILNWVSTKLYLDGIPTQHLIIDPSHLPMERLRFFYIDPNWLDCLIDGALSACNHVDRGDDVVRKAIKDGYNNYLTQVLPSSTHTPQIPRFGFILRSAVVKAFPGLHIDIPFPKGTPTTETRATICHLTAINDTTIMCLLDRGPEELESITITQPPHQQRFSVGEKINSDGGVEFELMELSTNSQNLPTDPKTGEFIRWDPKVYNGIWDPTTRCLNIPTFKDTLATALTSLTNYKDDLVTSLPIALELNDPCYYLKYSNANPLYTVQQLRQLWSPALVPAPPSTQLAVSPKPIAPLRPPVAKIRSTQPRPSSDLPTLPPHIQSGVRTKSSLLSPVSHVSTIAKLQYVCTAYCDYLPYPDIAMDPDYQIPTNNIYLMDLIINVQRVNLPSSSDDFFLSNITIDLPLSVPVGGKPPTRYYEPLIQHPYAGPGPRMLSNLRFTVSLTHNEKDNLLQCVLVPRGTTGVTMTDKRLMDLSFKLSQCQFAPIAYPNNVSYPPQSKKTGQVKGLGIVDVAWREGYQFVKGGQTNFTPDGSFEVYKSHSDTPNDKF